MSDGSFWIVLLWAVPLLAFAAEGALRSIGRRS
jgi:hypothetical protein